MMRIHVFGAALAVLTTCAVATAAHAAVSASGDPALYWNQVLSGGLTGSPTVTSRSYAMVSAAIYDAVNATTGKTHAEFVTGVATSGGDTRAATAVAARNMLVALNPAKTAEYDAALSASLALVPNGAAKTNGMATGAAIATASLAARAADGSTAPSTYTPTPGIGNWQPTPPAGLPAAVPQWADVTPFLLTSPEQFRPAAPPNVGSAAYAAAYNEVMTVGSATSATRTADQSASATFWVQASGTAPWLQAGLGVAEGAGLSSIENARLFALISTSIADSVIGIWDAKYEYDFWRPVTAIRAGDIDGNDLTTGDALWTPFITTPNHPSYISGHSGVASAGATILENFFGDAHNFCLLASGLTRCWDSFSDAAQDAANSRLWGGIHWRFDNEAGTALGRGVAEYALNSKAFDAVPEPAAWGLMLLGFGCAGGVLRRSRQRVASRAAAA
jgi:hypothetical protein